MLCCSQVGLQAVAVHHANTASGVDASPWEDTTQEQSRRDVSYPAEQQIPGELTVSASLWEMLPKARIAKASSSPRPGCRLCRGRLSRGGTHQEIDI